LGAVVALPAFKGFRFEQPTKQNTSERARDRRAEVGNAGEGDRGRRAEGGNRAKGDCFRFFMVSNLFFTVTLYARTKRVLAGTKRVPAGRVVV